MPKVTKEHDTRCNTLQERGEAITRVLYIARKPTLVEISQKSVTSDREGAFWTLAGSGILRRVESAQDSHVSVPRAKEGKPATLLSCVASKANTAKNGRASAFPQIT